MTWSTGGRGPDNSVPPDAGPPAVDPSDARPVETGLPDAGRSDAGPVETGPPDAGRAGAGPPVSQEAEGPAEAPRPQAPTPDAAAGPPGWSWRRLWRSWAAVLVLAVVIAVLLRTFVIGAFSIPSTSMIPTLQKGDRILVDKIAYDLHGVHRGDVVVFRSTQPLLCGQPAEKYLVKRIIGLPGDRLSSEGNTIYVDGRPLSQPWLPKDDPLGPAIPPTTVPAGQYYVLGDNRGDSCDSRFWGSVPRSHLLGPAVVRFWPISRFRFL